MTLGPEHDTTSRAGEDLDPAIRAFVRTMGAAWAAHPDLATEQGYLEFATASAENRELLGRPVRMASAGERFEQWQAWIPWFNSVEMVPTASYDALILVDRAAPTTPL